MKIKLSGALDNIILYENDIKQRLLKREIIDKNINENTKIIIEDIKQIAEKLNYKINRNMRKKFTIGSEKREDITINYDMIEEKIYSKYFMYAQIEFDFFRITPDLLLLIDKIYTYLESKNRMYRRWEFAYWGNTSKEYLIIYANSIFFVYNHGRDNRKSIEQILEEIICKELKCNDIFRYYKRKKIALMEMEKQDNIKTELPLNKPKYTYNGIDFIGIDASMSYKKYIMKLGVKRGTINVILETKNTNISTEEIKKVSIYKCINVCMARKNACKLFYVIDVLQNKTNRKLFFGQEPYLRLIVDKEIEEQDLIKLIQFFYTQIETDSK